MSGREAFGPNLRRIRVQRGVSLKQLADKTKVADIYRRVLTLDPNNADAKAGLKRVDSGS